MASSAGTLVVNFLITGLYLLVSRPQLLKCIFSNAQGLCHADRSVLVSAPNATLLEALFLTNLLVLAVASKVFARFAARRFRKSEEQIVSPRDFTLLIKLRGDLYSDKAGIFYDDHLRQAVDEHINPPPHGFTPLLKIEKVVPIFRCDDYIRCDQKRLILVKHLRLADAKGKSVPKLQREYDRVKEEYRQIHRAISTNPYLDNRFTGYVLVTFATEEDMRQALQRQRLFRAKLICMTGYEGFQAPEPEDLIWHNWGVPFWSRVARRVVGFLATYGLILLDFLALFAIKLFQNSVKRSGLFTSLFLSALNLLFSGVNLAIGALISLLITKLIDFEKYQTFTERSSELVRRTTFAFFVNSVLLVLVVNAATSPDESWNVLGLSGVLGNVATTALLRVVTLGLLTLVDTAFVLKMILRRRVARHLEKGEGKVLQCEANEAFEHLNVSLGSLYVNIFKSLYLALFYQLIFPLGLLVSAAQLAVYFFAIKYVVCSRVNRPVEMEFGFSMDMIRGFEFGTFLLAAGFLVLHLHTDPLQLFHRPLLILIAVVGLFEWLVGDNAFHTAFRRLGSLQTNEKYRDHYLGFWTDYDRLNPIGSREAINKFLSEARTGSVLGKTDDKSKDPQNRMMAQELTGLMNSYAQLQTISGYNAYLTSRGLTSGERTYATDIDLDILEDFSTAEAQNVAGQNANLYAAQLAQVDDNKYAVNPEDARGYAQLIDEGGLNFPAPLTEKPVGRVTDEETVHTAPQSTFQSPMTRLQSVAEDEGRERVDDMLRAKAAERVAVRMAGRVPVPEGERSGGAL